MELTVEARDQELPVGGETRVVISERDDQALRTVDPLTLNEVHGDINVGETISQTENVYNDNRVIKKTQNSVTNIHAAQINYVISGSNQVTPDLHPNRAGTTLRIRQQSAERKGHNKAQAKKRPLKYKIAAHNKGRPPPAQPADRGDRPRWKRLLRCLTAVIVLSSAVFLVVLYLGPAATAGFTNVEDVTTSSPYREAIHSTPNAEDYVRKASTRLVKNQSKKNITEKPGAPFALHDACHHGRLADVNDLLHGGVDINKKNPSGDTALYLACASGHVGIVKQLLRQGAAVNVSNGQGRTPLHAASANGHTEVVELLCEYDAFVNVIDFHGKRPLNEAIAGRHMHIVKILIDRDADVNPVSSPVGFASRGKKPNIPKLPEIQLPLMSAVTLDDEESAKLLLEKGARINTPDSKNWTELHMAAYKGNLGMVKLLIQHSADIHAVTELGATPLILASQEGHEDVVTFLLQHGADVSHVQKDNAAAVMLAAQAGHDQVVSILLQHLETASAAVEDRAFEQVIDALYLALQEGHSQTVDILTSTFFLINGPRASKLLLLASFKGKIQIVKHMLTLGVDPNVKLKNDATPLILAAMGGHEHVVDLLLSHGADVGASLTNGETPLSAAIRLGYDSVFELLLNRASKEILNKGDSWSQMSLLGYALDYGCLKMFSMLLKHGADPTLSKHFCRYSMYSQPVLCTAIRRHNTPFVRALLYHGASPNVSCDKNGSLTPLFWVVFTNQTEIVELLLDRKAAFTLDDSLPIMVWAAFTGDVDLVRHLIVRNYDLETVSLFRGDLLTPLGTAARFGHTNVVQVLLEHGAKVNVMADVESPLFVATSLGHTEQVKLLLRYNTSTEVQEKSSGATPLFAASQNGNADIVKLLLDSGANKNTILKRKVSSYSKHQAEPKKSGDEELFSDNLHNSAKDLQFDDLLFKHISALCMATFYNRTEVVALLVQHGADTEMAYKVEFDEDMAYEVESDMETSLTPLYIASTYGFEEIVEIFVKGGANVNFRAEDGSTPLHAAGKMRHMDIMDILIKYGADQSAVDDKGKTPWELAVSSDPDIEQYRNLKKKELTANMEYARS